MGDFQSANIFIQKDKLLFPELSWSQPENKNQAGKLLLIGGNLYDIARISSAAQYAEAGGAGTVRVLLPESVRKVVGPRENVSFGPSSPSGGFEKRALGDWLVESGWADMVLLPGELGRNSQTAMVLEGFINKYAGPLVITRDAIDLIDLNRANIMNRPHTTLVATISQLQKLIQNREPITHSMNIQEVSRHLSSATANGPNLLTLLNGQLFVASDGQVSISPCLLDSWRLPASCQAAVWLMQFPNKPFEALTTAVFNNLAAK